MSTVLPVLPSGRPACLLEPESHAAGAALVALFAALAGDWHAACKEDRS